MSPTSQKDARELRRLTSQLTLARERERRRIAVELHDNIGQNLAFMRMKILDLKGDAIFSGFDKNLEALLKLLDQTIAATRSMTSELSPPILHELGLVHALEWLAERFQRTHELTVHVAADNGGPHPPEAERGMLFTSVRELLINVVKHASATRADVTILHDTSLFHVVVEDDGNGFDPAILQHPPEDEDRFGLMSVRERFTYAGGAMDVKSEPGKGTRIMLSLPHKGWSR